MTPRYHVLDVIRERGTARYRRRWKIIGVGPTEYLVQTLFTAPGPAVAYWNTDMCEAFTHLEFSPPPPGNICFTGKTHNFDQPCDCSEPSSS